MKIINIPNIITCCNLLCGCMAILFGLSGHINAACIFIIAGAVFDFFDGMTARAMGISGPIGKELDSLADAITFGVAPSVLCYHIIGTYYDQGICACDSYTPKAAFIMAAFSALRLAKFNCDERQSLSFIGLPTPANALLWIGLVYLNQINEVHNALGSITYLILMLLCSYLLICELPMFSLKLKKGHNGFAENRARYIFLMLCAIIFIAFVFLGNFMASFSVIIPLYILMSIIDKKK